MIVPAVIIGMVLVAATGTFAWPRRVLRHDEERSGAAGDLEVVPDGIEHDVVTTDDGGEIHVYSRGRGTPVLFVHGLYLDHDSWRYQYQALADRFRVVGVDLRGHGTSTPGSDPVGPHRLAADLAAVMVHLDLTEVVLVGHSLGGTVIGQLCADDRRLVEQRVAGLVFVGTFAAALAGLSPLRARLTRLMLTAAAARPRPRRPEPSTRPLQYVAARHPFGPEPLPEQVRFTMALGSRADPAVAAKAALANLDYDVRAALDLDIPSLVVSGPHDPLSTSRATDELVAALTRPEHVVFDDAGHLPMLESRERFNEVLSDFVQGVTQP